MGHRGTHQRWISEWCETDEEDAITICRAHPGSDVKREACLASAAGTRQCQETVARHQVRCLIDLALAPDKAGQLRRQIARYLKRPDCGEFLCRGR